jgi:SAM-dependent methyltransferase
MEFSPFDKRGYATLGVRDGYAEWAGTYEQTVLDLMDLRLLARLRSVDWTGDGRVLDLACGTGRGGAWMRRAGVRQIEGIDLTEPMLEQARAKGVYDRLSLGDVRATGLASGTYRLVTQLLADEHMPDLAPLYREVARLLAPAGQFVIVGYHPHFLMMGIATHFDRASGESVAIESHVHLTSDHVGAAHAAGLHLVEMVEGVVDDSWIAAKPKWEKYRHHPVTFAMVWRRP